MTSPINITMDKIKMAINPLFNKIIYAKDTCRYLKEVDDVNKNRRDWAAAVFERKCIVDAGFIRLNPQTALLTFDGYDPENKVYVEVKLHTEKDANESKTINFNSKLSTDIALNLKKNVLFVIGYCSAGTDKDDFKKWFILHRVCYIPLTADLKNTCYNCEKIYKLNLNRLRYNPELILQENGISEHSIYSKDDTNYKQINYLI